MLTALLISALLVLLVAFGAWIKRKPIVESFGTMLYVAALGFIGGALLAAIIGDNQDWPMKEVERISVIEYTVDSQGYNYRVDLGNGRSQWHRPTYSGTVYLVEYDRDDIVLVVYREEMPADAGWWLFNPFPDHVYEFHVPRQ